MLYASDAYPLSLNLINSIPHLQLALSFTNLKQLGVKDSILFFKYAFTLEKELREITEEFRILGQRIHMYYNYSSFLVKITISSLMLKTLSLFESQNVIFEINLAKTSGRSVFIY